TPDARKGACPVWGGLGGSRRYRGARRLHSPPSPCCPHLGVPRQRPRRRGHYAPPLNSKGVHMPKPTKANAKTKAPRTVHDKLLEAVGAVDRPGTFCTSSDLPLVMPGLEVDGLGAVRLPLGKTQARQLRTLCRQAPYGKG